jgi:hypothetical protein
MSVQPSYRQVNVTEEADTLMAELVARALVVLDEAGYVVTPKVPNRDMILEGMSPAIPGSVSEIYREMIKARPEVVLREYTPPQWDAAATLVLK